MAKNNNQINVLGLHLFFYCENGYFLIPDSEHWKWASSTRMQCLLIQLLLRISLCGNHSALSFGEQVQSTEVTDSSGSKSQRQNIGSMSVITLWDFVGLITVSTS